MGAGGAEGGGAGFYNFIFLFMRWKLNEAKGTNVSIIQHNNESRRYASNLKTKISISSII